MKNPDQLRHILKTISWRVVGTIDTMVVSFFITGSIKVGMAIGGFEVFTKMVLYYFHERLWFKYVSLGRSESATSNLPLAASSDASEDPVLSSKSKVSSNSEAIESQQLVASGQSPESNSPQNTVPSSKSKVSSNSEDKESQSPVSSSKYQVLSKSKAKESQLPVASGQQNPVSSSKSKVASNSEDKESQVPGASSQMPLTINQKPETHIVQQSYSITLQDRIQQQKHAPKVFWMTGLSGSGKSTIANALQNELFQKGYQVYVLDGDNVRGGLNKDLDFSDEGRIENIRRISEVAKLFSDAGFIVITAFISPFRSDRQQAREIIGDDTFCEVFVDTPLEVCEQRDVKGLYKKARAGEIPNFTGIGSAFEKPEKPEVQVKTQEMEVTDCVKLLEGLLASSN